MATVANFTSNNTPIGGARRQTLAELMAKRKLLAEQQSQNVAPREMGSWTQGAAQLANTLVTGLQGRRAAEEEATGREQLAQIRAGINLDTGPTADQIASAGLLDPDYADKLTQLAADAVRARRERQQHLDDLKEGRTYEEGREAFIDTREEKQELGRKAAENTAKQIEHERDVAEGRARIITGDEAKQHGGDPTRQYKISNDGSTLEDVTPEVPDSYRPPTQEEIEAYGLKPDQPVRVNTKTGKPEAIGGGPPALQPVPSEVGAKIGLADLFLDNFDSIRASAEAGEVTGLIDQPMSTIFGRGEGGETYRQIRQGTEGLVRLMTGAGMPQSEAEDRARQYEPKLTDDAATLVSKLDGLKAAIDSVRKGATYGRNAPAAPGTSELPEGVTEDDIAETMRANDMTREQVIEALKGGK